MAKANRETGGMPFATPPTLPPSMPLLMMVFWMLLGGAAGVKLAQTMWQLLGWSAGGVSVAVPVGECPERPSGRSWGGSATPDYSYS